MIKRRQNPAADELRNRCWRQRPPKGLPGPIIDLARSQMHRDQQREVTGLEAAGAQYTVGLEVLRGQWEMKEIVDRYHRVTIIMSLLELLDIHPRRQPPHPVRPAAKGWYRRRIAVGRTRPILQLRWLVGVCRQA